ncbi:hypothetical protein LS684_17915 [Cytobacillus spongiae]|jgi:hypothetical protein|uniref:hypothetical protein n=1 Tax=Cytobacillus spongiae TaxID=2901381 RepID=UPI001F47EC44|nr:hypothetical protein [Cytobacillus spongiae]UII55487.1 hypothetical protein LS684_17915 [Cytobacillus spongiae]
MEPKKPGSEKMPDFDSLSDRVIAKGASQPMLVIKTNLDPTDSTEDNPYFKNESNSDIKAFRDYFTD